MADAPPKIQSYEEFWPFYLSQHSKRETRLMHVIGTGTGLILFVLALFSLNPVLLIIALAVGYGIAWGAHMQIEKNRPATFTYPFWSLRADLDMLRFWLMGRLESELVKYHIHT